MMTSFIQSRFKTWIIFLILMLFIGFTSVYLSTFYMQYSGPEPDLLRHHDKRDTHVLVNWASKLNATTLISTDLKIVSMKQPYHKAYPCNYNFILNEPDICEHQKPFLVLVVPVAPLQLNARNAIRSTWGNESVVQGKKITVFFMLGLTGIANEIAIQQMIQFESKLYHDIIQSNFIDTNKNLTIKTMVIMNWLATYCPQASYAMKVNSNVLLNLENLISLLLTPNLPTDNYISGKIVSNGPVNRDQHSRQYLPRNIYPRSILPTHLAGVGYVFSKDLPEKLISVSKNIEPFFVEEVYIGACLQKLGIAPLSPADPSKFQTIVDRRYINEELGLAITIYLDSAEEVIMYWRKLKGIL